MSKLEKGYGSGGMQAILGDIKTYFEGKLIKKANTSDIPDITGKADKVTNATSGHLAGLDSNGNLTDSGVSPTEEVTVEGNPVTFDSPFEQDAKSVVVSVKPIQDLHGLPFPYVGGAYKNKLPLVLADIKAANTAGTWSGNVYSINGGTITILTDADGNITGIKANGTFTGTVSFSLYVKTGGSYPFESANYILNGCPKGGSSSTYKFDAIYHKNDGDYILAFDYGLSVTADFTTIADADSVNIRIVVYAGIYSNLMFYPMIRLAAETDPTFAPYSNICPISGIDELEIPVTGKNRAENKISTTSMSNVTWTKNADGSITVSGTPNANSYIVNVFTAKVSASMGKVTFSGLNGVSNITADGLRLVDKNGEVITTIMTGTSDYTVDLSSYPDVDYLTCNYMRIKNNVACSGTIKPQVELGSVATAFEPFVSHTTTIPLPSTLYDADVDVTNGDADSRFGMIDLGTLTWFVFSSGRFYAHFSNNDNVKSSISTSVPGNIKCTHYKNVPQDVIESNDSAVCIDASNPPFINIMDTTKAAMTVEEFKAAMSGVQLCYELATPTTISFTPTDVELLEGTNVVTTNAEKVAVTYKAGILATLGDLDDLNDKVKTKFDKKDVAKVEGANASKPYVVGDYMLRSDGFYVVTQAIAQNAPITSNNTDKTTVGNELSSKVDTDDSRLSDARTPVAHTHNISDITGIPAWTKLGEVTGTSPDYANSSTFNLSALQNKDVLMIFSVDEGTLTAKQGIITLEYSAFEFGKILEDSVQEEDEITRLWKGFYGGAPRESVATFEEFLRGLGYIYIATHSTTAEIGAKIYDGYDWTLEIYTK